MAPAHPIHQSKFKILDAALIVFRSKGYAATRIEDICAAASLTKGSFFYHFKTKEELAIAAAEYWSFVSGAIFESADYHSLQDPLERLLGYVDFRKALLQGELPEFTCLVGTLVQEIYDTHPLLRSTCEKSISGHAATLEADITEAIRKYRIHPTWTPRSLALYIQAVIQGAFVLAKAKHGPEVAAESLDHLRRHLELLFTRSK